MKGRVPRTWTAAVAAIMLAACSQAFPSKGPTVTSKDRKTNAAALLKHVGLAMPPAAVEFYEYDDGLDDAARVKLVMSEADWATMRNEPALRMKGEGLRGLILTGMLSSDHGDWRPQADGATIIAHRDLPDAERLTVGYAPAGPGRVRVYLFWHQT